MFRLKIESNRMAPLDINLICFLSICSIPVSWLLLSFLELKDSLKGNLRYKTILCHKATLDV